MKYYEAHKLAKAYSERAIDMMEGRRGMPPVHYYPLGKEFHAHEFDLCIAQSIYRRIMTRRPMTIEEAIAFLRGRVIERALAEEADPIEVDGITMRIEDKEPREGLVVSEIKSTLWGMHFFDPVKNCPWGIRRGKVYCYGANVLEMGITVVF